MRGWFLFLVHWCMGICLLVWSLVAWYSDTETLGTRLIAQGVSVILFRLAGENLK